MAERKRLAAALETSAVYLPDFREIIRQGEQSLFARQGSANGEVSTEKGRIVNSVPDAELVAGLEKFRKILCAQSFDTLLLELAVVHERNWERAGIQAGPLVPVDNPREQFFTSHIISYLGRIDERSLLINAWNEAIVSKLLTRAEQGRFSIMAYEQTYDSSFLAEQFNWAVAEIRRSRLTARLPLPEEMQGHDLSDEIVEARNTVLSKFKQVHEKLDEVFWPMGVQGQPLTQELLERYAAVARTDGGARCSPTVYNKTYQFCLMPSNECEPVENAVSHLVAGTVSSLVNCWVGSGERSTAHLKAILDFLMNCCLLLVPFRRPIAYATSPTAQEEGEFAWGDRPGGCLFAIVRPTLGGMVEERQMDDLARRLSLALTRAALRESHVTARRNLDQEHDMRVATHHIPSAVKEIRSNLKDALSLLDGGGANLEAARQKLNLALTRSGKLHNNTEVSLRAYKVGVGAEPPRRFLQTIQPEQLTEWLGSAANELWRSFIGQTQVSPSALTITLELPPPPR